MPIGIKDVSSLLIYVAMLYHIAGMFGGGKFGEFGESSVIHQLKPSKFFPLNYIQSSCVTHLVYYTPIFIVAVALLRIF